MIPKISNISFKGAYLIQIPKKEFDEPENINKCLDDFETVTSAYFNFHKKPGIKSALLERFNLKKAINMFSFYEMPGYVDVLNSSKFPLNWIKNHTGEDIPDVTDEDYHSFLIFTKKEKDKMINVLQGKDIKEFYKELSREINLRSQKGLVVDKIWQQVKCYQYLKRKAEEIIGPKQIEKIKLESFSDLSKIYKRLEYEA